MLFNSLSFAVFLPVVFLLYWFVAPKNLKLQNLLLLVSSYYFYASWDWRFLFLLLFSTGLDYITGIQISQAANHTIKKTWFWLSVSVNLGFLGIFKYFNFFSESFAAALSGLGFKSDPFLLQVLLPLGISFYTFHGLSYVIDIYKGTIRAERNFISYAVFVSFFPLLVAGPIERATHLLPQIKKKRVFKVKDASDGLRQILWGLFKKIVIADQCAVLVNAVFSNSENHSGSALAIGAIFFAFQVYGDFSGYSDIAIGTARLFGINLLRNFAYPYFSRSIPEFWRRWHISLSAWFRDYVYIPLGGSRGNRWFRARNLILIFALSGLWHGANWTFLVWGLLHAVYMLPAVLLPSRKVASDTAKPVPTITDLPAIFGTFTLFVLALIFFRATSIPHALSYIAGIFSGPFLPVGVLLSEALVLQISIFFIIEWLGRRHAFAIAPVKAKLPTPVRWGFYYALLAIIFIYAGKEQQFIYFQF